MRVHTALSRDEINGALRESVSGDGVYFDHLTAHRSQSHDHAFEVRLTGVPGRDRHGKARRKTNTGQYGAGAYMAATYDEWGYFMAAVFSRDPFAKFGSSYNGAQDFMRKTDHRYPVSTPVAA